MLLLRQSAALVLLLACSLSTYGFAQQQQFPRVYTRPNQTVDLAPSIMGTARENCENWALAAGLETMLANQNVPLKQNFWVMRLNGGELCVDKLPAFDAIAQVVNREFVLDDGRHVRLELRFTAGPPVNIDGLIAGLKQEQLSLLLWRGHPYYLTGLTYDERIGRDGTRFFEVKEIRQANTFAKLPGVTFEKGRDDPAEIQGILRVTATQL